MSLILTILNKPNPGQEISSAFQNEGTIGRGPQSSWVMIDPERSISNNHAKIHRSNGEFLLTDTSTNGVFINNASMPLGKDNSVKLNHGDKLKIGEYDISVTIQAEEPLPLGDPDSSPFNAIEGFSSSPTGEIIPAVELGRISATSSLDINGDNPLDPLAMLNSSDQAIPTDSSGTMGNLADLDIGHIPPMSPFGTDESLTKQPFAAGTTGDNSSPMQQQFEPPRNSENSSTIPDDWNINSANALPTDQKILPATDENSKNPPFEAAMGSEPIHDSSLSIDNLLGGVEATPQQAPPSTDISDQPTLSISNEGAIPQPAQITSTSTNTSAVMQNLLRGLGLEHLKLSAKEEQTLALHVGQFTRTTVEGLVAVLRARASIKSEFRMSMTIIQARENNPLKFSPTAKDAINHLFSPATSSYMPAVQAVNESFNDMEAHMIAVMAGMQTALNAVLKRFDPAMLEQDFANREKAKGFSIGGKKAKYWDIYNTHYKQIISSVEDDFHNMFGDEFSRAYEKQVAMLKAAKKTQR